MVGDFVREGSTLFVVHGQWDGSGNSGLQSSVALGSERVMRQDAAFGFRQLVDIANRALSPGINDPTTAIVCIDRIAEALVCLGQRGQPCEVRTGKDGAVRLVLRGPAFDRLVDVAYRQIRHYGAGDPRGRRAPDSDARPRGGIGPARPP